MVISIILVYYSPPEPCSRRFGCLKSSCILLLSSRLAPLTWHCINCKSGIVNIPSAYGKVVVGVPQPPGAYMLATAGTL